MPGGWSKPRDVAKLADSRAEFDYAIPCAELSGLKEGFSGHGEVLRLRAVFGRLQGLPVAEITLQGAVSATCQRCLAPMRWPIDSHSRVAVVSAAGSAGVPESCETFLAEDGHVSLLALADEELLLALPLVPRHAAGERCGPAEDDAVETQRPFAELGQLLAAKREPVKR